MAGIWGLATYMGMGQIKLNHRETCSCVHPVLGLIAPCLNKQVLSILLLVYTRRALSWVGAWPGPKTKANRFKEKGDGGKQRNWASVPPQLKFPSVFVGHAEACKKGNGARAGPIL